MQPLESVRWWRGRPVVEILVFAIEEALVHLTDELLPEQSLLLSGGLPRLLLNGVIYSRNTEGER